MERFPFVEGWEVRPKATGPSEAIVIGYEWQPVTLPHDAVVGLARDPAGSSATAYYPGGMWQYRRIVDGVAPGRSVVLEFEGVYRDAVVLVNGTVAATRPNGYVTFLVAIDHLLDPVGPNEILVECRAHDDSRWYSGAGIHRPVWWWEGPRVHVAPDGLLVRTVEIDDDGAVLDVEVTVDNVSADPATVACTVEVVGADGTVLASQGAPVTTFAGDRLVVRRRLFVASPQRWSPGDPTLHRAVVSLHDGSGAVLDAASCTFGIRTLTLDPQRGLRINGEPVLLRGACIHHDNGPLGAVAIDRAEERRIELLHAAGFNAVRSSHNPASRALLEACDRLGVLVMDEAFDVWTQSKREDDYALRFAEWWDADLTMLTRRAVNHPSVMLISTGNEIGDGAQASGRRLGRLLAERVRAIDPGRYVTQAITARQVDPDAPAAIGRHIAERRAADGGTTPLADLIAEALLAVARDPGVSAALAEPASYLDVIGYNYMQSRLRDDAAAEPQRVVVASESHPTAMAEVWADVEVLPNVIGEFTWAGWDYLGEVGVGRTEWDGDPGAGTAGFTAHFPWRSAWCADLDVTGRRRPQSYCREVVFGLATGPFCFVAPPDRRDRAVVHSSPWGWSPVERSWTWPGHDGAPVDLEVYAAADEVEFRLDGELLGRASVETHRARFTTTYHPGVLEAVAFRAGSEVGRDVLRTAADEVRLRVTADRVAIAADPFDLAYVTIELVDAADVVHPATDRSVSVVVDGPGVLAGLASGHPCTDEPFTGSTVTTDRGHALAVVRPTGVGTVAVTVRAAGLPDATATVSTAAPPPGRVSGAGGR